MRRYFFALFFLLLLVNKICAQEIKFRHLNTESGLSHNSVLSLYEDEFGYIWIGTREGLNKYNGSSIDSYQIDKDEPSTIFSNNIKRITGNKKGKIYVLCTDGLSEYDIIKEQFTSLWHDSSLNGLYYKDHLYVTRKNIVYQYDEKVKQFIAKYNLPSNLVISSIYIDQDSYQMYLGCNDGLYLLNLNTKDINQVLSSSSPISNIYKDSENFFWISTWNEGLFCLKDNNIIKHFTKESPSPHTLSSNFIRECCEDNSGNLWIGTFAGLNKYNKATGEVQHYTPTNSTGGLSHSSVWSIIKDQQGTIWISTYFGGVNYFNPELTIHKEYKASTKEQEGLSSPIIGRMTEDNQNNLWICTEGAGVNVLNRKTGKFKWYLPLKSDNSISHNNIKAIYYDSQRDEIWFGTHLGGLNRLQLATNRFTAFKHSEQDSTTIASNIVRDIQPWRNFLFLATDKGVSLFNRSNNLSSNLFKNTQYESKIEDTYSLLLDSKENLWISVIGEGVYQLNLKNDEIKHFFYSEKDSNSISSNNINSIYEDQDGAIFFCTSGRGLDIYNPKDQSIRNFRTTEGVISDFIYNIIETHPNSFLITTNLGFSLFDKTKSTFKNYSVFKGLPLSAINDNSLYLTEDKEVFIGGMNGLMSFKLEDLEMPSKKYSIYFDRLFINNQEISPNDSTSILSQSLLVTQEVTLKAKENTIDIDVTTNNFIPYNKKSLEYRLEGFSNKWITLEYPNRRITYTKLPPGIYNLIVRELNNEQKTANEATLKIRVLPPWYQTPLAYISYLTILGLISFYLIRTYKRRLELQTSLKYEKEHIKNLEKLNQSKLNFFTNISHEFRTPLTVIIGQLSYLLDHEEFPGNIYNKILTSYKNSLQLNELITELLDFRKQEEGHIKIRVEEHNIVDFLQENYILFKEFALTRNIHFHFSSEVKKLSVWFSDIHMQKVINNLLSNAFKFTPEGGEINIHLSVSSQDCIIEISDTGKGIDEEDLQHIFDQFYQVDNSDLIHAGSGIGLAFSKGIIELHHGVLEAKSTPKEGSIFSIYLKLGNSHFSPDQLKKPDFDQTSVSQINKPSIIIEEHRPQLEKANHKHKDTKLLIVEDNTDLRLTLVDIFKDFYEVIDAPDGEEGLKLVQEENPDIIISDIVMPKMTGIELCKAVKTDINTCHIPFILLTAKTSLEHNLEGLKIGADDYISKPFNMEILISRCNNLINSRRLLQEVFSKQPQMTAQKLATNPLDKETLERASTIIEKNMDNTEFNLNDFAKEMGMSRTNLFTKIKALTGQTPNNFISTIRLKKAAYLLKAHPELNITEIATMTGFNTSHYFSKCFRDAYQQTPSDYRKE